MKYLGIDYGAKRVGLAVSDEAGVIAFPRGTLLNDDALLPAIRKIITEEKIEEIIIGDTLSYSNMPNPVTAEMKGFVEQLKSACTLPVREAHEAGSSVEAGRYAPEHKEHDDSAAAAFILQRFLDMHALT